LLKAHLSAANVNELTQLLCGASVQQARELLAARFPRPDVPATIRKLPTPTVRLFEGPGATLPGMMESTAPAKPSARVAKGELTPLRDRRGHRRSGVTGLRAKSRRRL
jgi:hypothetical protein